MFELETSRLASQQHFALDRRRQEMWWRVMHFSFLRQAPENSSKPTHMQDRCHLRQEALGGGGEARGGWGGQHQNTWAYELRLSSHTLSRVTFET